MEGHSYLISHYRPARRARVCRDDDAAIVDTADDCGAGRGSFGEGDTLGVQGEVSVVVAEVEARHSGGCACGIGGVREISWCCWWRVGEVEGGGCEESLEQLMLRGSSSPEARERRPSFGRPAGTLIQTPNAKSRQPQSESSLGLPTVALLQAIIPPTTLSSRIGLRPSLLPPAQVRSFGTNTHIRDKSGKIDRSEGSTWKQVWDAGQLHEHNTNIKMNFGGASGGGGGNVSAGPDLEQIETEQLAFQSVSGEDKLRLLPSPWPADNLPSTTSSLLSVASTKGLVAAAGLDALIVTATDSLRQSFINDTADEEKKVINYIPQATIPVPRVSQVAFSSDESCLVIAAEQGGGLAVYDTNALASGGKEPAFQLGTEGESVRQLLPNPNPSPELSRYFCVVTDKGHLLLADLKEQKLVQVSNGSAIFHDNVSCACWSRLGKQIVAGLANGTAVQIDHQGVVKASIPEPPQLAGSTPSYPITSIFWLETYDFLLIHTPVHQPADFADSTYHLAHKDKTSGAWTFSKFTDPCPPFGLERKPAHHFVQRLRDWSDLTDLLVLASTASTDIGIFTRSRKPLSPSPIPADAYTYTQPPDQRRAAMPMSISDALDTSPIGMAVDLSIKEKAPRPIPTDETLEESPTPLPALYVLNNEGMLSMWWIVYNDSIRQNQPYPDLVAAGGPRPLAEPKQPQPQPQTSSAVGASASAQPSAFARPTSQASSTPAAFGGAAALGARASPWSAAAAGGGGATFGKPSFGTPSTPAAVGGGFGQIGGMGANQGSVWGTPLQQTPQQQPRIAGGSGGSGSVFGGNASAQSPFMSLGGGGNKSSGEGPLQTPQPQTQTGGGSGSAFGSNTSTQSPFMNVGGNKSSAPAGAAISPFANLGAGQQDKPSVFGGHNTPSLSAEPSGSTVSLGNTASFGSGSTNFGVESRPSVFGSSPNPTSVGSGGAFGSGGFKLGSTFKGDGTSKDDVPMPKDAGAGLFGKGFGDALGDSPGGSATPVVKKEPGTEQEVRLGDIPTREEEKVDEAPLPPDPTTWKPKPGALPPPVPPGFGEEFGKVEGRPKSEDAGLPSDFGALNKKNEPETETEAPLAGSPPVDLGQEKFSEGVPSGSEAQGPGEGEWSDEDEGDDEGSDEEGEEEEDEEEQASTPEITDPKGLSAFEARLTPASPKRAEQRESTTPATEPKKDSYTPAGLPKAPIMFAPPVRNQGQDSPRSPSPVRSATSPLRSLPSFSAQQPSSQAQAIPRQSSRVPHPSQQASSRTSSSQRMPLSQSRAQPQPPQRIAVPPAQLVQAQKQPAAPAEPDAGELEDEEDARIQAILAAPVERTKEVPAFLTHQDYVAGGGLYYGERTGLGGQIERVYRDVNSMVDTLALNARGLRGFVEGNAPGGRERSRFDLEDEEAWVLGEASELGGIVEGVDVELEDGQLEDVQVLLQSLTHEGKEMVRLRSRGVELRKGIAARSDPEQLANQLAEPLPMETAAQQAELRQGVQRVQKLLARAEEQASVLRAELAALPSKGEEGRGVPTVEAVTNTIVKMTAMVEKRSGDVDVLESQIRRLGGLDLAENYEDDLVSSMKASKLGSPAASRTSLLRSSRGGKGTPGTPGGKKSLFDVTERDVEAYRVRKDGRRRAAERLREQLQARGPRVVRVG